MDVVVAPFYQPHFRVLHGKTSIGAIVLQLEVDFKHSSINHPLLRSFIV
jgi:hypothetical protein